MLEAPKRQTRLERDVRHTRKGRQGQERMLDTSRKRDKAMMGCYTHLERQTRPGRDVRHTEKGR